MKFPPLVLSLLHPRLLQAVCSDFFPLSFPHSPSFSSVPTQRTLLIENLRTCLSGTLFPQGCPKGKRSDFSPPTCAGVTVSTPLLEIILSWCLYLLETRYLTSSTPPVFQEALCDPRTVAGPGVHEDRAAVSLALPSSGLGGETTVRGHAEEVGDNDPSAIHSSCYILMSISAACFLVRRQQTWGRGHGRDLNVGLTVQAAAP